MAHNLASVWRERRSYVLSHMRVFHLIGFGGNAPHYLSGGFENQPTTIDDFQRYQTPARTLHPFPRHNREEEAQRNVQFELHINRIIGSGCCSIYNSLITT